MNRSLLAMAALSACAPEPVVETAAPPPPVEVRASVDKAVATTGDIVTYRIEIERDKQIEVSLPEPGSEIAGFRVVDLGRDSPIDRGERTIDSRWYELRADLVGSYVLPSVEITWQRSTDETAQTTTTSEIFIEVASVLPADGEVTDIRDIKPLRRVEPEPAWRLAVALGAGLLLIALAFVVLLWRRQRTSTETPPIPPHVVAFAALDGLRSTDFHNPSAVHAWHFAISEVLRTYVEARYGINATDLTREEILVALRGVQALPQPERKRFIEFLAQTDRVKFAGYPPAQDEITAAYESALTFVEETQPQARGSDEAA